MRKAVGFVVGVVAVAVLAVGCGGDSDDESSSTTTQASAHATTSVPGSDPRTPAQLAADRAQAEKAVLQAADFPAGWTGEADTDEISPEEEAARERFAECLGVDRSFVGGGARAGAIAESDDFQDDSNQSAQSTVTMVYSRERALQQFEVFGGPAARGCFERFVDAAVEFSLRNPAPGETVPPGVDVGQARVDVLRLAGLNTDSIGYRARVPITAAGESLDVLFDVILALKGRAGITMTFSSFDQPFPSPLATSLTNKVIERAPSS